MFHEKIIEIIIQLLTGLKDNKPIDDKAVDKLAKQGYTQNEINTAFGWLYTKIFTGKKVFSDIESNTDSKRIFHPAEIKAISPEARGFLIQLRELNLLNQTDLETVIEKIMMSGYPNFNLGDVKLIAASYLLDEEDMNNSNRRIFLNKTDTVN